MDKKVNILLFHPWIKSFGGAEKLVYEYTLRSKNRITILTWLYSPKRTFDFRKSRILSIFPPIFEPMARSFFSRAIFSVLASAITLPPEVSNYYDILLLSSSGLGELFLLTAHIGIPKIAYIHTPLRAACTWDIYWNIQYRFNKEILRTIYKFNVYSYNYLEKKAWSKIDFAIFNSRLSLQRAKEKKLITDYKKVTVIYPGVELERFYFGESQRYFLYVARYGLAKRQHILIKAFSRLLKDYPDERYQLILIGGLENKKYFNYLVRLAKKLGVLNKVKFLYDVPIDVLVRYYAHSLAFVHIPFMEDFGISPIEAAAAGKYIINVYPSGNYEILKDAPGVYWIKEPFKEERLVDEVYKAMKYFIENKDSLIELGKKNRKFIMRKNLSWERFAKEMDQTLEEVYSSL